MFNLGTNRWTSRLSAPFVVPLGSPGKRTTFEVTPSVYLFTDNTEPTGVARVRSRDPAVLLEAHLTRKFTAKLWGSVSYLGRWGGETWADGIPDNNAIEQGSLGGSLGYQVTPSVGVG